MSVFSFLFLRLCHHPNKINVRIKDTHIHILFRGKTSELFDILYCCATSLYCKPSVHDELTVYDAPRWKESSSICRRTLLRWARTLLAEQNPHVQCASWDELHMHVCTRGDFESKIVHSIFFSLGAKKVFVILNSRAYSWDINHRFLIEFQKDSLEHGHDSSQIFQYLLNCID